MKKIHRVLVLLLAALMALSLITTAFAEPTIDPGKKASLSIYKYDITKASNDGAWDAESYVSAGLHDDAVIDKLSKYAIQGVEFTYLRVADITMNSEAVEGQRQVGVLYGFDGSERSNAVLSAIGLTGADTHKTEGGINYFTSDRTICGELLLQQVLLAVFLILLKLLFGIDTNAAQVELLHDRGNALGADSDATFGQCDANLFGAIPLTTIIKSLPHQMHKLRLLLVALVAVCTAKDMVVKCTASDIQCLA